MKRSANVASLLKLENQLCFPIYAASRLVTQAYTPMLKKFSLTYPQYLVLLVLWENDGLSVKEIGERLFLDSGTLTPLLKKLEATKYIQRKRSRDDDRTVLNFVTEKAKIFEGEAVKIVTELICQSKLSVEDAVSLRDQLSGIVRTFADQADAIRV